MMMKKEIQLKDGRKMVVGFKEIGSSKDGLECHILQKSFFWDKSVFHKVFLKGILPNYKEMALSTIFDYECDLKKKQEFLEEKWS